MQTRQPRRLRTLEYGGWLSLNDVSKKYGVTVDRLLEYLERAAARIYNETGLKNPFEFNRTSFRPIDIAGIIRLADAIELEVIPKFLTGDEEGWREDFFAIASLAKYGHILPAERLMATANLKNSLADLVSQSVVRMYLQNQRRPIRVYKAREWFSFDVDGEIDPESVVNPNEDGFLQFGAVFDRRNEYNYVIKEAVSLLKLEATDSDLKVLLEATDRHLGKQPQSTRRIVPRQVPPRHRQWQNLYELCLAIKKGFGIGLQDRKDLLAPGFLLRTAEAWESLILLAARAALPNRRVIKRPYEFAIRCDTQGEPINNISVTPDLSILAGNQTTLVADAKYKTAGTDIAESHRVSAADLYEAKAFLEASKIEVLSLIYPLRSKPNSGAAVTTLEIIRIGSAKVIAIGVDPQGISASGGFRKLASGLGSALMTAGA